jgi:serine phosphatase RsbU (regulator of sigma subunit)
MHRYTLLLFLLLAGRIMAQPDSLRQAAAKQTTDSARARVYLEIARHFYNFEGQLDSSYKYYGMARDIFARTGPAAREAQALNGQSLIYREKGIYKDALSFALKALSIAEKCKDTNQITASLNGIAIVNQIQKDYSKAYEYYKKCEEIQLKKGAKLGLASTYNNLGLLFSEKRQPMVSLNYFNKALKLNEALGSDRGIATNCENIGLHYLEYDKDPAAAMENFRRSIAIWRGMNDKNSVAITLDYIASALIVQNKYAQAADTAKLSLALATEAGSLYSQRQAHEKLYQCYQELKNVAGAFDHYKAYIALSDSLKNDDKLREITQMQLKYEFDKAAAVEKLEQELQKKDLSQEINRQKIIILCFLITLIVIIVFMIGNRRARKKIAFQKGLLEERNKSILDSIKYAKHIQEAILPPADQMQKLLPEHFVLYKPKDIVSGDFYWLKEKNGKIYFAVVDCTGHGVPGAFMSIVGSNGLTEALNGSQEPRSNELLDFLNNYVNNTLNQSLEHSTIRDGMDISVCVIDVQKRKVEFSGANNPLWLINPSRESWPEGMHLFPEGKGVEIPADKQPIGNFIGFEGKPFTRHEVQLIQGDMLIMLTDGYADQFGGEKGKKFKYRQLQRKLVEIHARPCGEQKMILEEVFSRWKGPLEQVDDVCVIGLRF